MGPARGPAGNKKPKGIMTAYACFVKVIRAEHKKKHPNEDIVFAEFSKKCGEKWATMDVPKKERFHEMSLQDKTRYEAEMEDYVPAPGEEMTQKKGAGGGSRKGMKQKKDPNAPKKGLCGFIFFCNDERPKVKSENPDMGIGDIAKILGAKWKQILPQQKVHYDKMAMNDKKRYEDQMRTYKAGGGGVPAARPVPVAPPVHHAEDMESDESGSDEYED